MNKTLILVVGLLAVSTTSSLSTAYANMPCSSGRLLATSANGRAQVEIGPHGCQHHPVGVVTVTVGNVSYRINGPVDFRGSVTVSDTGRTVVSADDRPRADQNSFVVYRDGDEFGTYPISQLLGADHRMIREGLFVTIAAIGTDLVIQDLRGNELLRRYLGDLPYQPAP